MPRYTLQSLALILALMSSATSFADGTANQDERRMHAIRIIIGERIINATLEHTPSSRDFIAQLPLSIDLEDYSSTEKIAYLPRKLATTDAPSGVDPDIGDITYYAPWGNLAIFYRDFGYSRGLIKLGRITAGLEHLSYIGSKPVKIELAPVG
ncbi:cyclophilin-like fold protein [Pseudomonas lopnurensis]|uniref:cyclophilin-like fold protein n=1 Tax=Pseudomonas lopnurensis TaxID=1477517 RepID=UPI0028AED2B2|nr:cyclophilin-like fold protein [Pseudomonas lopnurensis]